jgi:hypothetical protein
MGGLQGRAAVLMADHCAADSRATYRCTAVELGCWQLLGACWLWGKTLSKDIDNSL